MLFKKMQEKPGESVKFDQKFLRNAGVGYYRILQIKLTTFGLFGKSLIDRSFDLKKKRVNLAKKVQFNWLNR